MKILLRFSLILSSIFLFLTELKSQDNIPLGHWRSHFNYTEGIKSVKVKNRVYCATENGLFYLDTEDNSIHTLSKIDGFSEVNISSMGYDEENDVLMIAYYSTNIDVVKGNEIKNLPDLKRKFVIGKKTVNDIYFYNGLAYISTSFGIVVYDEAKHEVRESYQNIGENGELIEVYSCSVLNDTLYAATEHGIRMAPLGHQINLLDYRNWSTFANGSSYYMRPHNRALYCYYNGFIWKYQDGKFNLFIDSMENGCRSIEHYNNYLVMTFDYRVVALDPNNKVIERTERNVRSAFVDEKGNFWYTKKIYTLARDDGKKLNFYFPDGPATKISWSMTCFDDVLYVAGGALSSTGGPLYTSNGMYIYEKGKWINKNFRTSDRFKQVMDILKIAVDPVTKHAFIATYGWGLAEYYDGDIQKIYKSHNSSLGGSTIGDSQYVNIRGLAFDQNNNLWVANYAALHPLSVRYANGKWKSFDLGSGVNRKVGDLVVDFFGQKWITLPNDGGLIVFDEKRTGTKYKKLTTAAGQGALPSEFVRSIAIDLDGKIWVGTDDGVGVFYSPGDVFSGYNFDAQKIWVENGDESGYLLAATTVNVIAVDGANNKWLGTRNGVYYVSEDGTEIIYHFTTENSPLPDNYIRSIAVNDNTGEVFFGTDAGIVSFRNYAIAGGETHGKVYAFPNPVRPEYKGDIAIRGLVYNARVKITDVAGNVVYETEAHGGQAVWDGKNFDGLEVKSGVYLIFSSDETGTETYVTKLLIIR